jgi:NAD(P)-dependent dehydrogenase (short-subunit alcohol dehydrogenase family)
VITLTRAMAVDHGAAGIRVNCVIPGPLYTSMALADGMTEEKRERRKESSVLGTEGTGWDVAYCALFLASDRSRYITGVAIPVDGGATLRGPARG